MKQFLNNSLLSPPSLLPLPASPSVSPSFSSLSSADPLHAPDVNFTSLANRSTTPFFVGHSAAPIWSWPCALLLLPSLEWEHLNDVFMHKVNFSTAPV